jgi:transposase
MDPYSGFLRAVRDHTGATVVLDHFHVIRLANQALTDLRCRRQQELEGHRGRKGDPLWAARRDLLRGAERLTPHQRERIRRAFRADPYDELECAWMLKESLRDIYRAGTRKQAEQELQDWYQLAEAYDLPEFHKLAGTLRRWQPQLLAYFDSWLSNGRTEGRNLVIKHVKRTGYGFRNFHNYRLRVLHRCA